MGSEWLEICVKTKKLKRSLDNSEEKPRFSSVVYQIWTTMELYYLSGVVQSYESDKKDYWNRTESRSRPISVQGPGAADK